MAKSTRLAAMVGTAVVAVAAAACSGGGGGGGSGGSLRSAMASVGDTAVSERFMAWGDGKELRALTGVSAASDASKSKANQKWLRLTAVALPPVADKEAQFTAATGIDGYGSDRYITVGLPPEQASRVDGADTGTVLRKFRQLGAREERVSGHTILAVAGEGQVDVSNPLLGNDVYLTLNRVAVNGSSVAFGLANAPVETAIGGGRSLADVPGDAAVADCLGDVVVAEVIKPDRGAAGSVTLVGIGVRRPTAASAPVTEVLCELTKTKDQTAPLASTIAPRVAPDANWPGSVLHVRDRVAQSSVDQVGKGDQRLVRISLDLVSPARAGLLLFDTGSSGLAFLEGGGPPGA